MPPKSATSRAGSSTPVPRAVRNTRPALGNGVNSAYGSRGVADLGAQRATGRADETYTHFQASQRVTRAQSVQASQSVARQDPSPVVEERSSASASPRPDTAIIPDAGYDASLRPQPAAPPPRAPSVRPRSPTPVRAAPVVAADEPGAFTVFIHTLPRYLPQVFKEGAIPLAVTIFLLACIATTLATLVAWAPLPASIAPHRDQFYHGLKVAVGGVEPPVLPESANVTFDTFWDGLLEKIDNDGATPLWESFLAGNEDNLKAIFREIEPINPPTTNNDLPPVIDRFEFEQTLAANNKMHEDDMRLALNNFKEQALWEVKRMIEEGSIETLQKASQEATNILSNSPAYRIENKEISKLSLSILINNAHRQMTEINYFSPGKGAIIDPHLTSRTASRNSKFWLPSLYWQMMSTTAPAHAPIDALTKWDEGGECWCAKTSTGTMGKAQLAVRMAHKINPQVITIEHIPALGTNDILSAPKRFAVWAQVENATTAQAMHQDINLSSKSCGPAPGHQKDWVCMLSDEYNIHDPNHVQALRLSQPRGDVFLETTRMVVRVLTNWGADDHTCLYRVRLTGKHVFYPDPVEEQFWRDQWA